MKKKQIQLGKGYIPKITIFLVLIIFIIPVILSYSNYYPPFFDKKYIYILDSIVVDIPFLPKTPKQVITKSFFRNRNLSSYMMSTNIKLEIDIKKKFRLVDLTLNNRIEKATSQTAKSKIVLNGEINFFRDPKIAFSTIKDRNNLYLKVDHFPRLIEFNLARLPKEWYKIDLNEFQKSLGVKVRNDQQIVDDVRSEFGKLQNDLVEKSIFSKVKSFKVINLKKEKFYQIKINLEDTNLQKLSFFGENLKFDKPDLVLLISSKTYYLTGFEIKGKINSSVRDKSPSEDGLKVIISSKLSQIGEKQNIEIPKKATDIKNSIDFALKLDQSSNNANNFINATKNSKDLGDNLLTLERLLSVITLLPKAI